MADSKLVDLTSGTAAATDIIYVVKDPSGTPLDRKVTLSSVATYVGTTIAAGPQGATGPQGPQGASGGGSSTAAIGYTISGGGAVITSGVAGNGLYIPYACTITAVTLLADVSGSIVVDIWKAAYASYPPTVSNTITASAKPTISSATKYTSSTLTGWTTSVSAGDILRFNVDSVTSIKELSIILTVTK